MLGIAIGCLLGLAILAFVLIPIVKEATGLIVRAPTSRSALADLYVQRAGAYATLKELEFDFETGKLIEQDYHDLRARYRAEAVGILRSIDVLEATRPSGKDDPKPNAV